jgi:D-xylose 1-dehydrogenase (NADP+, D-xylono-1,5-lactone-forming)
MVNTINVLYSEGRGLAPPVVAPAAGRDFIQRREPFMPTITKLRWGVLGVANITNRLLPAFRKSAHAELRAVASRSPEKAEAAAKAASIPVAHGSYEALLDDPDIDAVYIPLPNTLHAEWTRRAAERGKHILCEKPLTPTAAEARELVAFCAARKVLLMDGFMWPHHPRTARLRKFLDDGGIGKVERVTAAFTYPLQPLEPSSIRLRSDLAGGSLLDVGCYPVYGIRWAFGAEPVRAWASARYLHGVDVEMSGLVWLADGRVGAFDCGFTMALRGWLEITGTEGVVHIPDLWLPGPRATYTVRRPDRPDEEVAVEGEDQIVHMIDDFSRAVLHGDPLQPAPDEAVRTLRVLDALARSAREGREATV